MKKRTYTAAEVAAIRKKDQKIQDTIKIFEKIRDKVISRKKLTKRENELYLISTSYSFVDGAKVAMKRKLV